MGQKFPQIAERKCKMFIFRTSHYLTKKLARVHIRSCNQQLDGLTDIFVILLRNIYLQHFSTSSTVSKERKVACVGDCRIRAVKTKNVGHSSHFPTVSLPQQLSNQERVGKWQTTRSLKTYLALKYGPLTNTWVARCKEDGGLASSNNMTRHKGRR